MRFADADELLIAGLLQGGGALAEHAAVVDARVGKGHTVLFAINPIWRGETIGSYAPGVQCDPEFRSSGNGRARLKKLRVNR